MIKRKLLFSQLCVFAVFISAGPAPELWAQTAPSAGSAETNPGNGEELVQMSPFMVSQGNDSGYESSQTLAGTRSATDLTLIPESIDIIDHEMLSDLNAISYQQAIDFGTAGVTEFQNFQDDMMIRGFRSQSMYDGVVLPGMNAPSPLYAVDRVEVIKGPAAMLLGTNAFLGGAVNYIPILPSATPSGNVEVTNAIDEKGKSVTRLAANVLGPLYKSNDFTVLYRLTLGGRDGDMDKAIDRIKEYFVGCALLFEFNKNTSLTVNVYYYENDTYDYYDDFLDYAAYLNRRLELSPYSTTYSSGSPSDAFEREDDTSFDATFLTRLTPNGNLRIFYSFADTADKEALVRFIGYEPDGFTINRQYVPYVQQGTQSVIQADYLHELKIDTFKNNFYAGVDYTTNDQLAITVTAPLPSIDIRDPNPNYSGDAAVIAADNAANLIGGPASYNELVREDLLSYYLQDNVSFLDDKITLVAGLRWFYERSLTENNDYQYTAEVGTQGVYATPEDYPPLQVHKWGAVVKPVSWLSLYWTNATNETAQTGTYQPATGAPVPYGNQIGGLTEYGLKIKYKLADKVDMYATFAHFNMTLTNVFAYSSTGALAPDGEPISSVDDNTSDGIELEWGGRVFFGGGYADFLATAYRADTLAAGSPATQAVGAPTKVFSGLAKYTWTSGLLKGFMIGGGGYGQGARWDLNLPIHTPTTFNAFAHYTLTKNWSLQLNGDNLTNQRYIVRIATPALVEASMPAEFSLVTKFQW